MVSFEVQIKPIRVQSYLMVNWVPCRLQPKFQLWGTQQGLWVGHRAVLQ